MSNQNAYPKCELLSCFANRYTGHCEILTKKPYGECRFFKTKNESKQIENRKGKKK